MPSVAKIGEITETLRTAGELSVEWRIPLFTTLSRDGNHYYESSYFILDDGCWNLRVFFPNTCGESVWLYLHRNDAGPPKTVTVTVGVRESTGVSKRGEVEKVFLSGLGWCCYDFCRISELSGSKHKLMPGDALTVTCEIKIPDGPVHKEEVKSLTEESQSSEKEAMEELQSSLQRMLKSEEDCDIVMKVQGKEFKAHRSILRARSPVFQAMFTHDMVEKQRGVVTMEDCDPETFPDFLEHVYTGSIRMISAENVFSLYAASDKYDLKTLKKECTQFLKKHTTVACFCDTITLAVKHNERELIESATNFFCTNSIDIIKTAEWEIFLKENTTVGNELLIKLLSKT